MQRDLAEQRGWLEREQFLNGVALGQTMPGPLAAQVTIRAGFSQRGPDFCPPALTPTGCTSGGTPATSTSPTERAARSPCCHSPPGAPALTARGLSPVFVLEPGEVVVLAEFGCDLVEAAPLAL